MRLRSDTEYKTSLIPADQALPGRIQAVPTAADHYVFGKPLTDDVPAGAEVAMFAMGCFWGVERIFWQVEGVLNTAAGYAGGVTPNPTYEEVCSGRTGHTEVVRVVYDPAKVGFETLLKLFWENHDPTQGMRQGNDIGTQYRSAIYTTTPAQLEQAKSSAAAYEQALKAAGRGAVTTEIREAGPFYFAEGYHQQYLAKNPGGYCGVGGTGVACPIGVGVKAG
ncbi:MAG: peptide-methionine (S)-S-oxide reductase MsrA [Oceanicaulis sp.]